MNKKELKKELIAKGYPKENIDYYVWYQTATKEEKKLKEGLNKYEMVYFKDMTLDDIDKRFSVVDIFVTPEMIDATKKNLSHLEKRAKNPNPKDELHKLYQDEIPKVKKRVEELEEKLEKQETVERSVVPDIFIDLSNWIVKIANLKHEGVCKGKKKTIVIQKGLSAKETKEALLHEMIHAFEYELKNYPIVKEMLLMQLYWRLKPKIKDIDDLIGTSLNFEFRQPSHGLLFLLKSFDLDLMLKLPLGTIHSYERQKWFNE